MSVKAFGEALIKDAENMNSVSQDIKAQLVNPAAGQRGMETTYAVGADPRQETLHSIVVEHSQRMNDTNILLANVAMALNNTGLVCKALAVRFGSQDALKGASVDEVIGGITKGSKPEKVTMNWTPVSPDHMSPVSKHSM